MVAVRPATLLFAFRRFFCRLPPCSTTSRGRLDKTLRSWSWWPRSTTSATAMRRGGVAKATPKWSRPRTASSAVGALHLEDDRTDSRRARSNGCQTPDNDGLVRPKVGIGATGGGASQHFNRSRVRRLVQRCYVAHPLGMSTDRLGLVFFLRIWIFAICTAVARLVLSVA
jgi:hypothetical protein